MYLHVLGIGLVFINSPEAASDLLDKRGSIYSDKPSLVMSGELCVLSRPCQSCWNGSDPRRVRQMRLQKYGETVTSIFLCRRTWIATSAVSIRYYIHSFLNALFLHTPLPSFLLPPASSFFRILIFILTYTVIKFKN